MKTEEVCRTCLTDEGNFVSIQSIIQNTTIANMITDLTSLQIISSDGFTQSICDDCVNETQRAHEFREKCLISSQSLTKITISDPISTPEDLIEVPILQILKSEPPDAEDLKVESEDDSHQNNDSFKMECDDEDDYKLSNLATKKIYLNLPKKTLKNKGSKILFDCPLCHVLLSSNYAFNKHINEFHSDRLQDPKLKEERQPLGFATKKKNHLNYVYKCAADDFVANTMLEFRNHLKEHLGRKPITCPDCDYKTAEVGLFKKHRIQRHSETKRFACTECDYSCSTSSALNVHSAKHSTEKKFKCNICSMEFKRSSDISKHRKIKHEVRKKSHICTICQKGFYDSTTLKLHQVIHTGERPHVCHICGLSFAHRNNLATHVAVKHEPPKKLTEVFKCTDCNYSTKKKVLLLSHMKIHGELKYKCNQCSFKTPKNSTLELHMSRHTGDKKFFCEMCDYKSYTHYCLKIHMRIHTGEKPHHCTVCSYTGRTQNALQRHMQTHNPEQNYACSYCSYRTNIQEMLRRHMRKKCLSKKRGRPPSRVMPSSSTSDTTENNIKEENGMFYSSE